MKAKILGKLQGLIASAAEASRNGRRYTEKFWDDIFSSELFQEGIKYKMHFGELWHPEDDYSQVHPGDAAAVVLTKVDKKGLDYFGTFEILPTRSGEILKNLIDIGCTFAASSRGWSEEDTSVFDDASTYDLITFDIVAFPGIKSARLHLVDDNGNVSESVRNFSQPQRKNRAKIMENLQMLTKDDKAASNYLQTVLKKKEDFNQELQVEDVYSDTLLSSIEDTELLNYANVIVINDAFVATANDGVHGEKKVFSIPKYITPVIGEKYIVDSISYNSVLDCYMTVGEWVKIN